MALPVLELGLAANHEVAEKLIDHLYDRNDDKGLRLLEILLTVQGNLLKATVEAFTEQRRRDEQGK